MCCEQKVFTWAHGELGWTRKESSFVQGCQRCVHIRRVVNDVQLNAVAHPSKPFNYFGLLRPGPPLAKSQQG